MMKSVAVRRMKREAARTMASSAEPYRNGFVPTTSATRGSLLTHKPEICLNGSMCRI